MSGSDATAAAAELAEGILDEVSSADQDWRTIASRARRLAAVADAAAGTEPSAVDAADAERVSLFFSALSHATRILILNALRDGKRRSPAGVAEDLHREVALGNIAYHTRRLAELGLLARAGRGRAGGAIEHYYRLSPRGREAVAVVDEAGYERRSP